MRSDVCMACGKKVPAELAEQLKNGDAFCVWCHWKFGKCFNGTKNNSPCSGYLISNYPDGLKCIYCNRTWKDETEYAEQLVSESGRSL